jgi:hypothetical protein
MINKTVKLNQITWLCEFLNDSQFIKKPSGQEVINSINKVCEYIHLVGVDKIRRGRDGKHFITCGLEAETDMKIYNSSKYLDSLDFHLLNNWLLSTWSESTTRDFYQNYITTTGKRIEFESKFNNKNFGNRFRIKEKLVYSINTEFKTDVVLKFVLQIRIPYKNCVGKPKVYWKDIYVMGESEFNQENQFNSSVLSILVYKYKTKNNY